MSTPSSPQDAFVHGQLINLVRTGRARTRPGLEQETGLGRKLVAQRVAQAIDLGLLEDSDLVPSGGGRPSRQLRFRTEAGHVYAGLIEATEIRAAVCRLDGTVVETTHEEWVADEGPDETMNVLDSMFARLRRRTRAEPWAFGIGVSGPVDFATGRLVAPPIMPGWDGYSVRSWLRERYDAPVWVDNDVNLMALGEWHQGSTHDGRDLLYILIDTGVGSGLISGGRVFRGDTGAAGDIGHTHVTDDPSVICRCGQSGCLEAVTGGWGLVQALTPRASESSYLAGKLAEHGQLTPQDIGLAAAAGDQLARDAVLAGTRLVGVTVANVVNFANPGVIVVGGGALRAGPDMFHALEETVRRRVTKLAGQQLTIRPASLDFQEGVIGAGIMAIEHLFSPTSVGLWIQNGTPIGRAAYLQRASAV
jgi:predicted NBD/HSP70 family sugar kinase